MKTLKFTQRIVSRQEAYIDVPDDMTLEDACEYAEEHDENVVLNANEYVEYSEYMFGCAKFVEE